MDDTVDKEVLDELRANGNIFEGDPPSILHHYTTLDSLMGIIQEQELWATDFRFLNDQEEFVGGQSAIIECFKADELWKDISNTRVRGVFNHVRPQIISSFSSGELGPTLVPYVVSLSIEGDFLPQWIAYAKEGAGYCVGLALDKTTFEPTSTIIDILACTYGKEALQHKLVKFVVGHIEKAVELIDRFGEPHATEVVKGTVQVLISRVLELMIGYKAQEFNQEHEWRVIAVRSPDMCLSSRTTKHGVTPYVKLKFDLSIIKNVVAGPKAAEEDVNQLHQLLRSKGLSSIVTRSMIPFRG